MVAIAHGHPPANPSTHANSLTRREDYSHTGRYAIYYAPHHDSAWWRFGSAWLGRDAITNAAIARHVPPALAASTPDVSYLARITAAPRRYGFHATLKAPFRLKAGYTARDVYLQADDLAQSLMAAALPPVQLCVIDGFVALSFPREGSDGLLNVPAVNALAAQCVSAFDNLRARPDAKELARRHAVGLTPRQGNLLAEWGYPYVFQEFRFHMTLTNHLSANEQQSVIDALAPAIAELNAQPLTLDALAIYYQAEPNAPFVVTRRYGFDGSVDIYRAEV